MTESLVPRIEKLSLQFNNIEVTRQQLVDAARAYIGLPYSRNVIQVSRGEDGTLTGSSNCFGIFLLAAKDLGLLPESFDPNLPPEVYGQSIPRTLLQIINLNFDRVLLSEVGRGDLLLIQYSDVRAEATEPRHVAMFAEIGPTGPHMIHAYETGGNGLGKVDVVRIDALTMRRIDSVWRLRNLSDG